MYFDPLDPKDLAAKTMQLLQENHLRNSLSLRARQRATLFSYEKTAKQILEYLSGLCN